MAKKFLVTLLAGIFLNLNMCAAEDLKFIDAADDIGYFVDIDSLKFESSTVFTINMMIIRLNLNQVDVIDLKINHAEKNYAIRSTRTLSYDERTEIKSDNLARIAKPYSDKSLIGDVANIIIYGSE